MRRVWLRFGICVIVLLYFLSHATVQAKTKTSRASKPQFTAQAIIIVNTSKNKVLYSRNIHKRFPPASTVKLLTGLLACEQLGPQTPVTISKKAAAAEPTKLWLRAGDVYGATDLINAMLMSSANDASIALAEAVAGSEGAFANTMNKRARQLGAKNSHFTNASGLPDSNQYATAYDLYRIARTALQRQEIYNIMRTPQKRIKSRRGRATSFTNHNKLVFRKNYPTVVLKTGYTRSAKHCYAGKIYLDGKEYAFAFLKSSSPWKDIDRIISLIRQSKS